LASPLIYATCYTPPVPPSLKKAPHFFIPMTFTFQAFFLSSNSPSTHNHTFPPSSQCSTPSAHNQSLMFFLPALTGHRTRSFVAPSPLMILYFPFFVAQFFFSNPCSERTKRTFSVRVSVILFLFQLFNDSSVRPPWAPPLAIFDSKGGIRRDFKSD